MKFEATIKNLVLGGVAVVLLLASTWFTCSHESPQARLPDEFTSYGVCLETGDEVTAVYGADQRAPWVNPSTGRRTVYPWYYCRECQTRFVPELQPDRAGGLPRVPVVAICPECGSQKTVPWTKEGMFAQEPKKTIPPPPMP